MRYSVCTLCTVNAGESLAIDIISRVDKALDHKPLNTDAYDDTSFAFAELFHVDIDISNRNVLSQ